MESVCGNSGVGEVDVFYCFVLLEVGDYQISLKEGFIGCFFILVDCDEDVLVCFG